MKLKKLASLLLALVMALALAVPAMAGENKGVNNNQGEITINNAVEGKDYNLYQIFELTSYNGNAYSYKVIDAWKPFFAKASAGENAAPGAAYIDIDEQGYITGSVNLTTENAAEFATAALTWAKANNISATKTYDDGNFTSDQTAPDATTGIKLGTLKFTGLSLGYYLIDSSVGAACMLDTTAPSFEMTEKNEVPTIKKEVLEKTADTENGWGETNDASIGETVNFRVTVSAKKGAQGYVFHDTMAAGLKFDKASVKVTVGGTEVPASAGTATNYTVTENPHANETGTTRTCTFDVVFTQEYLNTLAADSTDIVITYSAVMTKDAQVGQSMDNTAILEYGDGEETPPSTTKTYTWEFDIFKYTDTDTPLAGAEFQVKRGTDPATATPVEFIPVTEATENDTTTANVYRVATAEDKTADETKDKVTTTIKSPASGKVQLLGLDEDTYLLVETAPPTGYNALKGPIKVVIKSNENGEAGSKTLTVAYETYQPNADGSVGTANPGTDKEVKVLNNTGAMLPSTGGIGTTIFYIVGGVLAAGAVILLITKRRMNMDK